MRVSTKVDCAVRTLVELARIGSPESGESLPPLCTGARLAELQQIPPTSLDDILADLRRADLVASQRGPSGGWRLARPAGDITIADVIRGVEGPLADVRGIRPDQLDLPESFSAMQRMWIALRAQVRSVLEHVTIADLAANRLDPEVDALTAAADAWMSRRLRVDRDDG